MKAISLWQPWSSLIACGAKRVETRHWRAPARLVGTRIAIHAAKTTSHLDVCATEPFDQYIPHGRLLPLGAILATVQLVRCTEMTDETIAALRGRNPHEHAFGHYAAGRFAWVLTDLQALDPVPWRGAQGFFDVPDEALGIEPTQGAPEPEADGQ